MFPVNQALIEVISAQKSQSWKNDVEKDQLRASLFINFCLEHQRNANLICLEDQKVLCSDCILFGLHKNHQFKKIEEVLEESSVCLRRLQDEGEEIKEVKTGTCTKLELEMTINHKMTEMLDQMHQSYAEVLKELSKRQETLVSSLEQKFSGCFEMITWMVDLKTHLQSQEDELSLKIKTLKELVQS